LHMPLHFAPRRANILSRVYLGVYLTRYIKALPRTHCGPQHLRTHIMPPACHTACTPHHIGTTPHAHCAHTPHAAQNRLAQQTP
jgi:hypothetical protein